MAALALSPAIASARSAGITSGSFGPAGCMTCHTPTSGSFTMPAPTVTLTPSATTVDPGQQLTLTLVNTNAAMTNAGLNVRATSGTFTVADANTRLFNGEITHTQNGKPASGGAVTFTITWTAPAAPGAVTFTGWSNSVNLNGGNDGDHAASATATVTVNAGAGGEPDAGTNGGGADAGTSPPGGEGSPEQGGCSAAPGGALACFGALLIALRMRRRLQG